MPEEFEDVDPLEQEKKAIQRLSVKLYNEVQQSSNQQLIDQFRSFKKDEDKDTPIFIGKFHLKKSQLSLINDSFIEDLSKPLVDSLQSHTAEDGEARQIEYSQIVLSSQNFRVEYEHYDA